MEQLAGTLTGYYAGSPMQLDFGEEGERKHLVLVEARPGRNATIETPELTSPHKLVRVEGTLDEVAARAPEVGTNLALVTVILGLVAKSQVQKGTPLKPEQAMEEAQLTKQALRGVRGG